MKANPFDQAMTVKDLKELLNNYPDYWVVGFDAGEIGYYEITRGGSIGELVMLGSPL